MFYKSPFPFSPLRMETERSHMIQRILDLTLEIIYLLTGENYIAFKMSDGVVTPHFKSMKPPCVEPPPISLIPARNDDKNFLEVTKKLFELLTGEVPIRCQDVAVYLSMEEREYLDKHCELYKAAMKEEEPPLTSPDGSRKINSPEPCPDPLYSQDSAQEEHSTPQGHQAEEQIDIKEENVNGNHADMGSEEQCGVPEPSPPILADTSSHMNLPERRLYSQDSTQLQHFQSENLTATNAEEADVRGGERCIKGISPHISTDGSSVRNPSKRCPPPLYSRNSTPEEPSTQHHYEGVVDTDDEEIYIKGGEWCAKKENPPEISTGGSFVRNHPESRPRPPYYSQYSTQEKHNISQHYQDVIKVEDTDEEEAYERDAESCAARKILSEISTDEQYVINHSEMCPITTPVDTDLTDFPGGTPVTLNFHPVFNNGEPSMDPSTHGGCFPRLAHPVPDPAAPWLDLMAPCYELNDTNQTLQNAKKSFSCLNCGKSFKHKSKLETHERTHNGHRPYACSVCEKRFTQKAHLDTHNRIHTGEKPFVCLTCGRNFRDRSNLITHQRTHTGLRPYSCLRCGKKFRRKMHQKEHICDHLALHFT